MLRPNVKRVTSYSAPHCGHVIAMWQTYRTYPPEPTISLVYSVSVTSIHLAEGSIRASGMQQLGHPYSMR